MSSASSNVSFASSQIGPVRTAEILGRLRQSMHVELVNTSVGRDDLNRYELIAHTSVDDRGGRLAFSGSSAWYSDGLSYHLYFRVNACRGGTNPSGEGSLVQLPENARGEAYLPTAVYRGDFNGDGRADFMVVLENGGAMVFTQNR